MSLPKPKQSTYFDRKKGVLDNWDTYPEDAQRYFIKNNKRSLAAAKRRKELLAMLEKKRTAPKKPRPVLDPETAARNKAAHARTAAINARNAKALKFAGLVNGWKNERGQPIPKTPAGIPRHQKLVAKFQELYGDLTSIRLNHRRIQLTYKNIHALIAQAKKQADYDAYHKAAAEKRERERIAREKAIETERAARKKRDAASAISQAKSNVMRLRQKFEFAQKQIGILEGYIRGDDDYIARIEPKLDGWRGTSLHSAMVRNVQRTKARRTKRQARLDRYRRDLGSYKRELADNQKFLAGKNADAVKPKADKTVDMRGVTWAKSGNFLKPSRRITRQTDIWVRPNKTGLLRVTSASDFAGHVAQFDGFEVTLTRRRDSLFVAGLNKKHVRELQG